MNKYLVVIVAFLLVACGNSNKRQDDVLLEYKIVKTEKPRVSPTGHISPSENLVYHIEINHPYKEDSLKILQSHFILKGEEDFPGINKIIVRVYLQGTSSYGVPYASLILIGANREIKMNESAESLEPIEDKKTSLSEGVKESLVGRFYCERSHDWYVFKSDNSGQFIMQGGMPLKTFWERKGNHVIVRSEWGTTTHLEFDEKSETLEEASQEALDIYGTKLLFHKIK